MNQLQPFVFTNKRSLGMAEIHPRLVIHGRSLHAIPALSLWCTGVVCEAVNQPEDLSTWYSVILRVSPIIPQGRVDALHVMITETQTQTHRDSH